ncbi:hypothetical protein AMJ82_03430 [candidate division TA06 bacterium SM23_40]|uniref:DUF4136 domain-containing protein n=1 Tax=candidate division TA06 bacterium SM23_40 TaxID=1703774 RepID=A0A0S8GD16_UNCT6|nr:MAG: hypothetical protein AMJ82_03430 [candidate division TA06 bacterium SM23_40]
MNVPLGSIVRPARRTPSWILLLSGVAILTAVHCTYTFSTLLPGHIQTISIPMMGNETVEYGLEERLTEQLVEEFIKDNHLRVVDPGESDSVLEGSVSDYRRSAYSYDQQEQVIQYQVEIWVNITYRDAVRDEVIWEEEKIRGWGTYFASTETEEDGTDRAIEQLASDVLRRTVEGW